MSAFFKKEWDHYFLTNKWVLFFVVFIALGIMNPFTAKITPALIENLMGEEFQELIGEPTAIDSWLQFFKNVPQLGLIAFILMMANTMSKELQDGTLPIFLAKGLKRKSVILSKALFHSLMWTIGYSLTVAVTYVYTIYYWDQSIVQQLWPTLFGVYLFSLFMIVLTLVGNTMTNSTMGGLAISGGSFAVLIFINSFFDAPWNPLTLLNAVDSRLTSNEAFSYLLPVASTVLLIIVSIIIAIMHFNRRTL